MVEIERKFLVTSEAFKKESFQVEHIKQGFLNRDPHRTVRVRLMNDKGILTVKGLSSEDGLKRFEWEKDISKLEAKELFEFCESGIIGKLRHKVSVGNHVYEIDEFYGDNSGLIIAEIELSSEDEWFEKPDWLGIEVTGDIKYYNSQLSIKPYKSWVD